MGVKGEREREREREREPPTPGKDDKYTNQVFGKYHPKQ